MKRRVPQTSRRPVWADVDLGAIRHNVSVITELVATPLMAVVKADAYGHGAVEVSRAALEGGAERLGVAFLEEAEELRQAGLACPIHLLSEPAPEEAATVVALGVVAAAYTERWIDALAAAGRDTDVHLKVDTGMHRVGARPEDAVSLARRILGARGLRLGGVWTHLAVSEEIGHPATRRQLELFDEVLGEFARAGIDPGIVHIANSGGALGVPEARRDLVRVGIAMYGVLPAPCFQPDPGLRAAMSLRARVSFVKRLAAGERLSYGLTYELPEQGWVATVPIGYADGYARGLSNRAEVLLRGRRRVQVAGTVTMDQILLDCGQLEVSAGDEVVLFGEEITAADLAAHLGTIPYEVLCMVGRRVPRVYIP